MSVSALGARALLVLLQQTELEAQQDTCSVNNLPQQQLVSTSNLLAKRRSRSRNSNSSCYDLSPLSIPQPGCRAQHNSRVSTEQSDPVKHAQSVERDASEIAASCLRLMVMRRLASSEHASQAEDFLRDTGNGGLNGGAPDLPEEAASAAGATAATTTTTTGARSASTPTDTDPLVGGCTCRRNELLARHLASLADEFGQTWCGRRTVDCARRVPLPPTLLRNEFDSHLADLLTNASSVRSKVSILLVLTAELVVKAVLLCNRLAIVTLVAWCQELLLNIASAFVAAHSWASLLSDENGTSATVVTVLALVLIGCTLAGLVTRRCRD